MTAPRARIALWVAERLASRAIDRTRIHDADDPRVAALALAAAEYADLAAWLSWSARDLEALETWEDVREFLFPGFARFRAGTGLPPRPGVVALTVLAGV